MVRRSFTPLLPGPYFIRESPVMHAKLSKMQLTFALIIPLVTEVLGISRYYC
jgi:hypothetical protein